jgi:hypothetical protein
MKLRFKIRDLFWLTLVVAMGLGWWLTYWKTAGLRDRVSELEDVYGWHVLYSPNDPPGSASFTLTRYDGEQIHIPGTVNNFKVYGPDDPNRPAATDPLGFPVPRARRPSE